MPCGPIIPSGARQGPIVPSLLKVIIDDISINFFAALRAVIPPHFALTSQAACVELKRLIAVEIIKDILANGSGNYLYSPVVHVKVFLPHPEYNVINTDCRIWPCNADVVA